MDLRSMLALPRDQVRALAPRTVVWAAGGTRRQATLAGMAINAMYHRWGWQQHLERVALLFDLGVQTLFTPLLGPPQAREVGPYREVLFKQLSQTIGGAESLESYASMGVRVRFYGQQHVPGLGEVCARVEAATHAQGPRTLWLPMVVEQNDEALWDALHAALAVGASSLEEAVRAFYGDVIPPVEVFIGFGKCKTGYLMPPLLGEHADLYWTGFPSYMLTEEHLRMIFWDHRFARATWNADKTLRYTEIEKTDLSRRYQQPLILGMGQRIGSFWHPWLPDQDEIAP